VKVIVVGNPCNTNCLIAMHHAPDIPNRQFTAMTRLDHNRGVYQLAAKIGCHITEVKDYCIWGNHSSTMVPDISHAHVNGVPVTDLVSDKWRDEYYNSKI